MNICQVIISEGWGGAETVVHELARYLRDRGHNVSIILNQEILGYYTDLENVSLLNIGPWYNSINMIKFISYHGKIKDVEYHYHTNRVRQLIYSYTCESLHYIYGKLIRDRVTQFLCDNHIDIIHSHMPKGAVFVNEFRNLKIPTVNTPHGELFFGGDLSTHPIMKPLVTWHTMVAKRVLGKVEKIVHVSSHMLNAYRRQNINSIEDSEIIYNGIDISGIQEAFNSRLNLKGEFNLLFPGGTKFVKGGDILLGALPKIKSEIPGVHVYIALDVPEKNILRKMVADLGLEKNVTFAGFLRTKEYRKLLNSVDLLVLPSRQDAFPVVCLEALALGKPVVASKVGGIPEIVADGRDGFLVEPNPDNVAQAIVRLYKDTDLRTKMSQNALYNIARFDWNIVVDKYIDCYHKLLHLTEQLNVCMLVGHIKHNPQEFLQPEIEACGYVARLGHNVTLIGPPLEEVKTIAHYDINGISTFVLPYTKCPGNSSLLDRAYNNLFGSFKRTRLIPKNFINKKYKLTIIGSHIWDQILALYLKRRYKIPYVFILENPLEQGWETFKLVSGLEKYVYYSFFKIKALLAMYVLKRADLIVPIDRWLEDYLAKRGIAESKMEMIPECFDMKLFSEKDGADIRQKYNLNDSKVIIYIGTMNHSRQLQMLIRAFALIVEKRKDAVLLMVGDGTDRVNLEKLAYDLKVKDKIIFTGQVAHSEIPTFIAAADIGISPIPPLSFYKLSSPIKIVEYLSMAKPMVANEEIPSHKEVIEASGGGILVPFREDTITDAAVELLCDRVKAVEMGQRGQEWVIKNRSFETCGRKLEKRYLELFS